MDISVFAVTGGDERSAILASMLAADGYTVYASGFDRRPELAQCAVHTDAATALSMSEAAVLPVVPVAGGGGSYRLSTPLSDNITVLDDGFAERLGKVRIYTGRGGLLRSVSPRYAALELYDYGKEESFLLPNARLTAEAALMLAVKEYPAGLYDSRCLITGFGRIGKALAQMLYAVGADVTVCARKPADLALARSRGYGATGFSALPSAADGADIVFNTADALVITENVVNRLSRHSLIIELASAPGGTDFDAAGRRGIKTLKAWGLPGIYSPVTAAKIIKDTILNMPE